MYVEIYMSLFLKHGINYTGNYLFCTLVISQERKGNTQKLYSKPTGNWGVGCCTHKYVYVSNRNKENKVGQQKKPEKALHKPLYLSLPN